jgi:glucosamine--fructose-6-phosphate aminotransferase (isomerizing)
VITIGLVNNLNSSIANLVSHVIAIEAGTEVSVASTKSFVAQLMKLLHLILTATKQKELNSVTELLIKFVPIFPIK